MKTKSIALILTALALSTGALHAAAESQWHDLFDGKTLTGWVNRGGKAKYTIEEGCIVGHSAAGTENSFLCTEKTYGDFIFELDFKDDPNLNSGVQFRSECFDQAKTLNIDGKKIVVPAGRVHGYQYEIDMEAKRGRWWAGGIYDEARRKWLFPGALGGTDKAFTAQGAKLSKQNDWNHLRIEAKGPSIKTFLNGELRSEINDAMTPRGFFGLQVHGYSKNDKAHDGLIVRFRNIRIQELNQ